MTSTTSLPISIRNITKTYGRFKALDNVDLEIDNGEFMTLLGPSGSGKTTLLMVIAGFIRPTSGAIAVAGSDLTRMPPHRRNLGMVFQNYALFPHMTVGENVAYPLRRRAYAKGELVEKVRAALDIVQLGHLESRYPDQLSGGQKQRIALARAISFEPRILLMDEPLSALDKKLREHMQIEIRRLHERLGITTIYVTHDQREALTISDRIAVINEGRVVQLDRPAALYNRPRNLFVADFIGESTILPLHVERGQLLLSGSPFRTERQIAPNQGQAYVVMRPERLEVIGEDTSSPEGFNVFEGTVREVVFQGESLLAQVELGQGAVVSLRRSNRHETAPGLPAVGSRVRLGMRVSEAIVLTA